MTAKESLLIRLLAATDAVWAVLRRPDWESPHRSANFCCARRDFAEQGVPFVAVAGKSADTRMAVMRDLGRLVTEGLAHRQGGDRRTRARLTPLGDEVARALAGLPGVDAALSLIGEIVRIGTPAIDGPSACELELAGLRRYQDTDACRAELAVIECMAAPALWRGWVVADSTIQGAAWYCVTAEGREALKADRPETVPLPPEVEGGHDLYVETYMTARRALRAAKPEVSAEIGFLPLPAFHQRGWRPDKAERKRRRA